MKFKVYTLRVNVERLGGPDFAELHFKTRGAAIDVLEGARKGGGFCITQDEPDQVVFWPMSRIHSVTIRLGKSDKEGM